MADPDKRIDVSPPVYGQRTRAERSAAAAGEEASARERAEVPSAHQSPVPTPQALVRESLSVDTGEPETESLELSGGRLNRSLDGQQAPESASKESSPLATARVHARTSSDGVQVDTALLRSSAFPRSEPSPGSMKQGDASPRVVATEGEGSDLESPQPPLQGATARRSTESLEDPDVPPELKRTEDLDLGPPALYELARSDAEVENSSLATESDDQCDSAEDASATHPTDAEAQQSREDASPKGDTDGVKTASEGDLATVPPLGDRVESSSAKDPMSYQTEYPTPRTEREVSVVERHFSLLGQELSNPVLASLDSIQLPSQSLDAAQATSLSGPGEAEVTSAQRLADTDETGGSVVQRRLDLGPGGPSAQERLVVLEDGSDTVPPPTAQPLSRTDDVGISWTRGWSGRSEGGFLIPT